MSELFIDTSGWANLIDISQPFHPLSVKIYQNARSQKHTIITTSYIITELVALLSSPLRIPRPKAIAFIQSLKTSPYVEVIHISKEIDTKAWELLTQRQDKEWSLVDCSSFIVMQERKISESLTSDHHFEQAGFIRLLK
ncbi:VapC toxin family PIN domain ribonuclease [Pseudanabaena sp. SR411]|uniref:type II toxin-antitoxin system VapC family toxin n=1 Tax=Pseudanabaena sp. SR411 TaxID=1980935 RepID=UPI000B99B6EB|nr:PIN domain-containing protein [Pseudanabaena sp. SR411]OYQ62333.1 VapC toxin family PIN domain ribonuclease [Pseudanabaena sp. SR411]